MRRLGFVVVILVLLFPVRARAQSVKPEDLVGTWVGGIADSTGVATTQKDTVVFRPDSTNWIARGIGATDWRSGTHFFPYHLKGDVLVFNEKAAYQVTLKNQAASADSCWY